MSSIASRLFVLLGFACASILPGVQASAEWSSENILSRAEAVARMSVESLRHEFEFPVEVHVVFRKDHSPMVSLVSSRNVCLLVVNSNPAAWTAWEQFIDKANMSEQQSLLFASLHELGHCQNRLGSKSVTEIIPPGPLSEMNADLYALKKVGQLYGTDKQKLLAVKVIQGRRTFSSSSRSHDIGNILEQAIKSDLGDS